MTQDERFNAALDSVAWTRMISDPRFTDEMAQIEANADYRAAQQEKLMGLSDDFSNY